MPEESSSETGHFLAYVGLYWDIIEFHKVSYPEAYLEASDLEKRFAVSVGEIWQHKALPRLRSCH